MINTYTSYHWEVPMSLKNKGIHVLRNAKVYNFASQTYKLNVSITFVMFRCCERHTVIILKLLLNLVATIFPGLIYYCSTKYNIEYLIKYIMRYNMSRIKVNYNSVLVYIKDSPSPLWVPSIRHRKSVRFMSNWYWYEGFCCLDELWVSYHEHFGNY